MTMTFMRFVDGRTITADPEGIRAGYDLSHIELHDMGGSLVWSADEEQRQGMHDALVALT